ncbi:MAG: hypothetical protein Q4F67_14580 [Propionibacteriaceae bacterium]|nr:hypothetical protein [Propionibacteriaceae bacterium]
MTEIPFLVGDPDSSPVGGQVATYDATKAAYVPADVDGWTARPVTRGNALNATGAALTLLAHGRLRVLTVTGVLSQTAAALTIATVGAADAAATAASGQWTTTEGGILTLRHVQIVGTDLTLHIDTRPPASSIGTLSMWWLTA